MLFTHVATAMVYFTILLNINLVMPKAGKHATPTDIFSEEANRACTYLTWIQALVQAKELSRSLDERMDAESGCSITNEEDGETTYSEDDDFVEDDSGSESSGAAYGPPSIPSSDWTHESDLSDIKQEASEFSDVAPPLKPCRPQHESKSTFQELHRLLEYVATACEMILAAPLHSAQSTNATSPDVLRLAARLNAETNEVSNDSHGELARQTMRLVHEYANGNLEEEALVGSALSVLRTTASDFKAIKMEDMADNDPIKRECQKAVEVIVPRLEAGLEALLVFDRRSVISTLSPNVQHLTLDSLIHGWRLEDEETSPDRVPYESSDPSSEESQVLEVWNSWNARVDALAERLEQLHLNDD